MFLFIVFFLFVTPNKCQLQNIYKFIFILVKYMGEWRVCVCVCKFCSCATLTGENKALYTDVVSRHFSKL